MGTWAFFKSNVSSKDKNKQDEKILKDKKS